MARSHSGDSLPPFRFSSYSKLPGATHFIDNRRPESLLEPPSKFRQLLISTINREWKKCSPKATPLELPTDFGQFLIKPYQGMARIFFGGSPPDFRATSHSSLNDRRPVSLLELPTDSGQCLNLFLKGNGENPLWSSPPPCCPIPVQKLNNKFPESLVELSKEFNQFSIIHSPIDCVIYT